MLADGKLEQYAEAEAGQELAAERLQHRVDQRPGKRQHKRQEITLQEQPVRRR